MENTTTGNDNTTKKYGPRSPLGKKWKEIQDRLDKYIETTDIRYKEETIMLLYELALIDVKDRLNKNSIVKEHLMFNHNDGTFISETVLCNILTSVLFSTPDPLAEYQEYKEKETQEDKENKDFRSLRTWMRWRMGHKINDYIRNELHDRYGQSKKEKDKKNPGQNREQETVLELDEKKNKEKLYAITRKREKAKEKLCAIARKREKAEKNSSKEQKRDEATEHEIETTQRNIEAFMNRCSYQKLIEAAELTPEEKNILEVYIDDQYDRKTGAERLEMEEGQYKYQIEVIRKKLKKAGKKLDIDE